MHWTPDQALAVFEAIELIRDQLWLLYAEDIQLALRHDRRHGDSHQLSILFNADNDPF
jgi:hypothetical protein